VERSTITLSIQGKNDGCIITCALAINLDVPSVLEFGLIEGDTEPKIDLKKQTGMEPRLTI